ncbi:predicted protein [Naegleria gruberi]|uniref:Predicted protein n=1 Tax=Naegleria gruberi TaxID=5762 RepID=D2VLN0_NAEGR|nr:uncharacterized protein NAEGRDRAFT_50581 [Naegleria gruberi]EFC42335.1 predicted protein [Naegleria gruberi]|eukprot:XP_002675079.1 predicted protein [Naegleria gruberi strain NEG-M]
MTKVTPVTTTTTDKRQNYGANDSVSDIFQEEEEEENAQLIQSKTQPKRTINCPLRLFLMTTLSILIIVCAITVYLAVFVGMYSSVDELTNKMIQTVQGQVTNYIDRFLGELKMSSKLAAGHYNNGLVAKKDYRQYLYQGFNNSGVFVGYFLQVNNHSERFSYVIINGNFLYTYQDNGFPGLIRDRVNISTAQVIKYNFTVSSAPQNLETTEFYTSAISESNSLGVEGVFGKPFYVVGGAISLPYATKLYSTMYPVKSLIGICRATIPLYLLSEYLSGVKVFQKGYVILTELNSTIAVAGSIKTTTDDGSNNLSIFNLTQNNAGQLMNDISINFRGLDNIPSKFSIYSIDTKYIVSVSNYKFDNVWRMFIIAYDEDVSLTTNLSIGISIGVSILIIIIGMVYSLILSKMITRTVNYLEEQLMFVKVFDLEKVTLSSSIFKEMNQIIDNLHTTVLWLKQVKPFIPATVFYHIQSQNDENLAEDNEKAQDSNKQTIHDKNGDSKNIDVRGSSSLDSKTKSSSLSLNKDANSLFKMGLSRKTCAILHITFNKFELQTTHSDISVTLSKVSTMIRNIANIHQAHFQINSSEDIIIVIDQKSNKKHPSEIALECALKITNIIHSTNNLLKENDLNGLDFFIGISTSDNSHVGNIGSNSFRFFSFISNSRKIAMNLAILASSLGVRILLDEETFNNTKQKFITKPVDRILLEGSIHSSQTSNIANVYELVKEKAVAQDEWLYELDNLNSNKELESLNGVFSIFKEIPQEKIIPELDSNLALINSYLEKSPNDVAVSNLLNILEYYKHVCGGDGFGEVLTRIRNYCKKVNYQITTMQ